MSFCPIPCSKALNAGMLGDSPENLRERADAAKRIPKGALHPADAATLRKIADDLDAEADALEDQSNPDELRTHDEYLRIFPVCEAARSKIKALGS
jgi:hypothetical protein